MAAKLSSGGDQERARFVAGIRRGGWIAGAFLACSSTASAAVVTYTLSYNDDGSGGGPGSAPGVFAVYASDSADNGGIFGLGVDLTGPIDFLGNTLQGVSWKKTTIPTNTKFAGMLAGFATDPTAFKVSGLQDLSKGSDLIPVYGLGQQSGDLNNLKPDPIHTGFTDINGNGTAYTANLLVAVGTVQAGKNISAIDFDRSSVDNVASVWVNRSGTANSIAQVQFGGICVESPLAGASKGIAATCVPPEQDILKVTGTAEHANQAVGGSIAVTGSNGLYRSEVDQLLDPSPNQGSAPVQTIGDENGNLFVMAKVIGDAATVSAILSEFNNAASSPEAPNLHHLYDSQFGPGGFNLLFTTPNFAGAKVVNWDFSINTGAVIDQIAVVPEPGVVSGLWLGALMILGRRSARKPRS